MSFTIEGHNAIERACSSCKGNGVIAITDAQSYYSSDDCDDCGGSGLEFVDLACLMHNLAMAGALCAAHWNAIDEADQHRLYHEHGYRLDDCWSPGCGRVAP